MGVGYFLRGAGERWAVIRIYGRDGEEVVADDLSRDAAEALYLENLEALPRHAAPSGEQQLKLSPLPRRRPRQLTLDL